MDKKLISMVAFHTRAIQQAGSLIGSLSRIFLSNCDKCSTCKKPATFSNNSIYSCDRCEAERRVKGENDLLELDIAEDIRLLETYIEALDNKVELQ